MTAQHQDDRIRMFLAEGPEELPNRAFDAVRGEIHRTRQRVVIGPWRAPRMSNIARIALVAAAVIVVAIGATRMLPTSSGPGTLAPTPTRAPTPTPSPTASPTLSANVNPTPGALSPGTYTWTSPGVSFTVPTGWSIDADAFVTKHAGGPGEVLFTDWQITDVYPDVCHHIDANLVHAGTSTAQLVASLSSQKGWTGPAATDATVAGLPGMRLERTVPAHLDVATCTDGIVRAWPDPGPNLNGGYCCFPAGSINDLSIVDADGKRIVFIARHEPGSSATDQAELKAIVDSVTIEPPAAAPSPSGPSAAP
jgi:hypothetical protein